MTLMSAITATTRGTQFHGTKLHNSVQPSDAARLARVAVDVDEVLAYTYAVEAGLEEALQN
jgi:hypothetical protein